MKTTEQIASMLVNIIKRENMKDRWGEYKKERAQHDNSKKAGIKSTSQLHEVREHGSCASPEIGKSYWLETPKRADLVIYCGFNEHLRSYEFTQELDDNTILVWHVEQDGFELEGEFVRDRKYNGHRICASEYYKEGSKGLDSEERKKRYHELKRLIETHK